ncbi:MAG TPA: acylphosphatase [Burkholderiales bacterium]|nr:acylphosphatase [Burkholderiales bacterium]
MEIKTLQLNVTGVVQGVGFRVYMLREAQKLGVSGWVRNRADGGVEAMAQGESAAVDALVQWAHHGPRKARVSQVQVVPGSGDYSGFEILPTQ